ncbi:MAG: NAD(P)/FAD-dependent oxidoreductase [Verrucomicrobiota bacterium]
MKAVSRDDRKAVIVIGAGMAGLSCAVHLHRRGIPVLVLEAGNDVGGRVRTDLVNGFRLDRGFQVYLDSYPETGSLLNLEKLDLRPFEPGALVYKDGQLHRLMDVFRRPGSAFESVRAPVGSFLDKLRTGWLRTRILSSSLKEINQRPDRSTEAYLEEAGFSGSMIDSFFRSFYGGIFLERDLRTSSRMFEFTFKMFGKGSATLPSKGMGEIPKQLSAQLPEKCLRLNTKVSRVEPDRVVLSSGEEIFGSSIVVATDATVARQLLPNTSWPETKWRSVTNLYYAADQSPVKEPIICLNGNGGGLVNNVCALTDASPEYAEDGRALMSVSVLGLHDDQELPSLVKQELVGWFGLDVEQWEHLRTDRIKRALPEQLPKTKTAQEKNKNQMQSGIYLCGDYCLSASIEGAVISGKQVALEIQNNQ